MVKKNKLIFLIFYNQRTIPVRLELIFMDGNMPYKELFYIIRSLFCSWT